MRFASSVSPGERARRVRAAGGRAVREARFGDFSRVDLPAGADPARVAEALAGEPGVLWAEPDRRCRALMRSVTEAVSFDDPLLRLQWHHERIRLLDALDRNPPRGRGVVVAVLDTGVAFGTGSGFPTRRGIDLGSTTFLAGFDFVDGDTRAFDEGGVVDPDEPGSPRFGHGTFVAAQIAAAAGNGTGGVGIAPRVTILPYRVLGIDGFGAFSHVAEAIDLAVEAGADVINMSLGGEEGSTPLREAIERAAAAGVVLVAAAGNEAEDPEFAGDVSFPARYEEVLAVGATDFSGNRAGYSNHGTGLDFVAPGGGDNELVDGQIRDGVLAPSFLVEADGRTAIYGHFWAVGTSFSAPQASGVAALLTSLGVRDPEAIRVLLRDTARDKGPAGFDTDFGSGEIDALGAHRGVGFNR